MHHIQLSKSDTELFKTIGGKIDGEGSEPDIFYIPQYFRYLGDDVYEVLTFDELPEYVKDLLPENEEIENLKRELQTTDLSVTSMNEIFKKVTEETRKWHPDNY